MGLHQDGTEFLDGANPWSPLTSDPKNSTVKPLDLTILDESDWGPEYGKFLQKVARHLSQVFQRKLTLAECYELSAILRLHPFTLRDGTVINGDDEHTCLGNRAAAAIAGCFHDEEERHDAQWWYMTLLSLDREDERVYHQLLGEIVAHPTVVSSP